MSRRCALPFLATIAIGVSIVASAALPTLTSAASAAPTPTIGVRAAWIRWLPAGLPAAGYLTLTNTGDKTVALDGASSRSYRDVSIHRSILHGTTEEMTPVKEITLEPHQTIIFESTGYHLMLMQPAADVDSASRIQISLHFSDGSSLLVPFEVRKRSASGSAAPP